MAPLARADVLRLALLAAIWGGSFIFLRVLSPAIGPVATATSRVALGGGVLVLYAHWTGARSELPRFWRPYVVVGIFNAAIPFALYAWAALHLPASYSAILNSATPLFAALLSAVWLDERLGVAKIAGLVVGAGGVALVSNAGPIAPDAHAGWAVAACLVAALSYALAGVYLRRRAREARPLAVAGWSQLAAAVALLPVLVAVPLPALSTLARPTIAFDILALALVCSALAYLLYYRLIRDVGPTRAMTVTFLTPVFAMLWGALFLGERITLPMLAGCALILGGTLLVLRPAPPRR